MTDLEQFNLLWLCHAMTAPAKSEESYYYDARTKKFFYTKSTGLFDMIDLLIPSPESAELLLKLQTIDTEASEIVEIPRLNLQDKVAIQLLFLSKFTGIVHEEDLRLAAEKQKDTHGFILDTALAHDTALTPVMPYWDSFKLKTIQFYLEKFTGLIGITSRLL